MYTLAGAKDLSFLEKKKRVFEGEGFTLEYTLFPSNKIYKKIDRMSK